MQNPIRSIASVVGLASALVAGALLGGAPLQPAVAAGVPCVLALLAGIYAYWYLVGRRAKAHPVPESAS